MTDTFNARTLAVRATCAADDLRPELTVVGDDIVVINPGPYERWGKRLVDVIGSLLALLVAIPILLVVWVALRFALGPDVVLRQKRIGRDGEVFGLYKFRTMQHDRRAANAMRYVGHDRRTSHKAADDPRHTPLGRLVRKFSLDELPQLVNVLRGDMSMVGPRPQLACRADAAFVTHRRHRVRPGLTGPFQVSDLRSAGDLNAGLDLDADYAVTVSFRRDLRWLAKTLGALIRGTGS